MEEAIGEIGSAMTTLGKGSPWSPDTKATDDFLDPLFANFFRRLNLPNLMRKSGYHALARFVAPEAIDPQVHTVLDGIVQTAHRAHPAS